MTRYSTLLAQFIVLSFLGGWPIGMIIYHGLFVKYGFQGTFASILAGVISLSIFVFIIYRKWQIEKDEKPKIAYGMESAYKTGNLFVSIGNAVAIFSITTPLFGISYVLGGVFILFGGFISISAWLVGWHWMKSSLIKY
jgi:hypothetical protein